VTGDDDLRNFFKEPASRRGVEEAFVVDRVADGDPETGKAPPVSPRGHLL
jgi:hypothetical protein